MHRNLPDRPPRYRVMSWYGARPGFGMSTNERHIVEHRVQPSEVEEVLTNGRADIETRIDVRSERNEFQRWDTETGRVLFVAWTP
jgi:hypothetical protein